MRFDASAHRWKHRLLFAFAPDDEHPDFLAQRQFINDHHQGLRERSLLFVQVLVRGPSWVGVQALDAPSAEALRRHHGVEEDRFVLVLVGKDGTEKARSTEPVPLHDVFDLVDQMPMRQREIAQRSR